MLRSNDLINVYEVFPVSTADIGAIKMLDISKTSNDTLSTFFLIEAERFWMATLLQLIGFNQLHKAWLQTWADVTLYYANFFAMNGILRLSGRTITHTKDGDYRIKRKTSNVSDYETIHINGGSDHKAQWNFYYDLIQQNITDDKTLQEIFDFQLRFRHDEREFRQLINYDLGVGFSERHNSNIALSEFSDAMTNIFPFKNTVEALATDTYFEIAIIVYVWKHTKQLLEKIAEETNFEGYWYLQKTKLLEFVVASPVNNDLKEWTSTELNG